MNRQTRMIWLVFLIDIGRKVMAISLALLGVYAFYKWGLQ